MMAAVPNNGSAYRSLLMARTHNPGSKKMIPVMTINTVRQPCRGGGILSGRANGSPGGVTGVSSASLMEALLGEDA
jgi:hypothetical protein